MKSIVYIICLTIILTSCGSTKESNFSKKYISSKNHFYAVKEITQSDGSQQHCIIEYKPKKCFFGTADAKTDYILIKSDNMPDLDSISGITLKPGEVTASYIDKIDLYYYPENRDFTKPKKSLQYFDTKFGVQTLTIPLKFRRSVGNDLVNPKTVETSFNVGLAPGIKFAANFYTKDKNYLGTNNTQIALTAGPHFGIGSAALKSASNAPNLISDRTAPMFSYGGYIVLGFNNINIGFAIGEDFIMGTGKDNWVYQGKTWTGLIIALDVIKF